MGSYRFDGNWVVNFGWELLNNLFGWNKYTYTISCAKLFNELAGIWWNLKNLTFNESRKFIEKT